MKYEKEFRLAVPETIGETDKDFDISNYTDFLESELEAVKKERDELNDRAVRLSLKADTVLKEYKNRDSWEQLPKALFLLSEVALKCD